MHLLTALSLAGLLALALSASVRPDAEVDEMIAYINSLEGNTWKAGRTLSPKQARDLRSVLGCDLEASAMYNKLHLSYPEIVYPIENAPDSFDSREKWPHCTTMKDIRYQALCGSCWSFGSVEAMSDRYCVHKNQTVTLSAEDPLSCCDSCGDCTGGIASKVYNWWISDGIVTGGPYGSNKGCYPYQIDPNKTSHMETPKCTPKCIDGYPKTYKEDKNYGAESYGVRGVENIMKEIATRGPVTATFVVYEDFMEYISGVYIHRTGKKTGGHVVKILGYGTEQGVDYWLVANSFGDSWGLNGFFKIAKGVNECGIEKQIVAGIPK